MKSPIHIRREYGKENVDTFRQWEKIEKKMADFSNHQRFSLRCLSLDLIPVSISLRSTIKTPKGKQIIKKVERVLLNERIRSINNTLYMLEQRRDTCIFQLEEKLDRESMEECKEFIKIKREARHLNTLDRQRNKLERLCQMWPLKCPTWQP